MMMMEFRLQTLDMPTHITLRGAKIWCIVVEGVHIIYSNMGQGANNKVEDAAKFNETAKTNQNVRSDVLYSTGRFKTSSPFNFANPKRQNPPTRPRNR